jgi:hypothetical protein
MYTQSSVATATYTPPPLNVTFQRTGGGSSTDVDWNEINSGTNEILFANPFHPDFGVVRYVINSPSVPDLGDLSDPTFHVPVSQFTAAGATIRAKYVVLNPHFVNNSVQTFPLSIAKLDLPPPAFGFPAPYVSGDTVSITSSGSNAAQAQTHYTHAEGGTPDPTSSSALGTSTQILF